MSCTHCARDSAKIKTLVHCLSGIRHNKTVNIHCYICYEMQMTPLRGTAEYRTPIESYSSQCLLRFIACIQMNIGDSCFSIICYLTSANHKYV